jgi:glucose/arabinose dehydrogenase
VGWDQAAADSIELATFRYALYVDGVRRELTGVTCSNTAAAAGFACQTNLPGLSLGVHTLELATFIVDAGTTLESPRSAPLRVNVVSASAAALAGSKPLTFPPPGVAAATDRPSLSLQLERISESVREPTDLAVAPDGRLFIAERAGRVRVLDDGRLIDALTLDDVSNDGENGLVALALDPDFDRSGFVYVVYAGVSRSGSPIVRLARFREAGNLLAERAVLLEDIPRSAARTAASIRFGPDARMYVAFDDGGDARRTGDAGSYNGKVLRLNPDGSTPADQPMATPVFAYGFAVPSALAWKPDAGMLWMMGRDAESVALRAVSNADGRSIRRTDAPPHTWPASARAGAMTFYRGDLMPGLRGDLLIAGGPAPGLMRVRFDPANAARIVSIEPLVEIRAPIRAIAVGPDGAIYVATDTEISRITPKS